MMLLDLLRNIYSASDGIPHPSAAFAAFYAFQFRKAWGVAYDAAYAPTEAELGRNIDDSTADAVPGWDREYEEEIMPVDYVKFDSTFAREMGWTELKVQAFFRDGRHELSPEGAMVFEEAYDAYDTLVEHLKNRGGS